MKQINKKTIRIMLNAMNKGLSNWTEMSLNDVIRHYSLGVSIGKVLIDQSVLLKRKNIGKKGNSYLYKWNHNKELNEEMIQLVCQGYQDYNKEMKRKLEEKKKAQEELFSRLDEEIRNPTPVLSESSDPTPIIEHPKARIKEEVLQQGLKSIKPDAKKEINILWGAIKINW